MDDGPSPTLRRRNSIATSAIPSKLTLQTKGQSSSFPFPKGTIPNVDFELISLKTESYTSLKDLLPSSPAVNSPTPASAAGNSGYEICIRNRLVKQAAWAYLQPMSSSPASSSRHFFRRMWVRFSDDMKNIRNPISACLGFISRHIIPNITRAFDRLLQVIRLRS